MEKQKKKGLKQNDFIQKFWQNNLAKIEVRQNGGITLIALIISIIVMLILAGVSLSAIVGDNGILTQAQNATYQTSIATLEEYMQELYVTNYDEFADETSKIDALLSKYPSYFYIPANEGIGGLRYIVDSDGHALYLIKKSGLPQEIQDQLQDGNAGGKNNYSDYMSLNDVYGITTDLKVYYCSNGVDTIMGVTENELNSDNPLRTVFTQEKNANIYALLNANGFDQDGNGTITAEECKSVKSLTIDSSSGITSFTDFYNLISLQEIIFDGVTLTDLKGLQNCPQLNYVYFKSSTVADYSALSGVSKLKYLYLYDIDDNELSTLCNGIKNAELSQLKYLAVVGNNSYISDESVTTYISSDKTKSTKKITSLTPLSILSTTTKEAIRYLSIQCNNIDGDLKAISGFTNLYLLRCEYNNLKSLDGLENMESLALLCGAGNKLGTITVDGTETEENTLTGTSIQSLTNKPKLEQVNLDSNVNLANVSYFENDIALKYLYLESCSTSMDISNIRDILTNCSPNYKIPVKFLKGTVYKLSDYYTPSEVTYKQLKNDLYENTYITHLNLEGITTDDQTGKADNEKITNDRLNEILKSMTNLKYLTLKDSTALTSIDFIASDGVTGLIELDLRNTGVKGEGSLSSTGHSLNDCDNLRTLRVSDGSDFKNIAITINRLNSEQVYWYRSSGIVCSDIEVFSFLSNVEELTAVESMCYPEVCKSDTWKTIDFSNTSVCNMRLSNVQCDLILPSCIEKVYTDVSGNIIFKENSTSIYKCEVCTVQHGDTFQNFLNSLSNAPNLNSLSITRTKNCVNGGKSWNDFLKIEMTSVKYLKISGCSPNQSDIVFTNLNGIEKFTNLETLIMDYSLHEMDISVFNSDEAKKGIDKHLKSLSLSYNTMNSLSGLENLTELTELYMNNSKVNSINEISSLTKLTILDLNTNNISNLNSLKNLTALQTLNLANNTITDTSTNSDGTTVNNLQILVNLNSKKSGSLTTLYLAGNSNIVDFTPVSSLTWTAKSGF